MTENKRNSKFQAPNSKEISNSNHRNVNKRKSKRKAKSAKRKRRNTVEIGGGVAKINLK